MIKDQRKNGVISAYNNAVDTFGDDDDIKYPLLDIKYPLLDIKYPLLDINARTVFKSSVIFTSQRYYNKV